MSVAQRGSQEWPALPQYHQDLGKKNHRNRGILPPKKVNYINENSPGRTRVKELLIEVEEQEKWAIPPCSYLKLELGYFQHFSVCLGQF